MFGRPSAVGEAQDGAALACRCVRVVVQHQPHRAGIAKGDDEWALSVGQGPAVPHHRGDQHPAARADHLHPAHPTGDGDGEVRHRRRSRRLRDGGRRARRHTSCRRRRRRARRSTRGYGESRSSGPVVVAAAATAECGARADSADAQDRCCRQGRKNDVTATWRLAVASRRGRPLPAMPTGHGSSLSEMESATHAASVGGRAQPGQTEQLLRRAQ